MSARPLPQLHINVDQNWLSHSLNLWNHTFKIKCFSKDNLEYFLHVYRSWSWTEDEWRVHSPCKSLGLFVEGIRICKKEKNGFNTCFVISSCSSRGNVANWSNFVPMRKGIAVWNWNIRNWRAVTLGKALMIGAWIPVVLWIRLMKKTHLVEASRLSIPLLDWI